MQCPSQCHIASGVNILVACLYKQEYMYSAHAISSVCQFCVGGCVYMSPILPTHPWEDINSSMSGLALVTMVTHET